MGYRRFSFVAAAGAVVWLACAPGWAQEITHSHGAGTRTAKSKSDIPHTPTAIPICKASGPTPPSRRMERPAQLAGKPTVTDAEAQDVREGPSQDLKQEDGAIGRSADRRGRIFRNGRLQRAVHRSRQSELARVDG